MPRKPPEPKFDTPEEAEAYDSWFRAKVENSLASTKPRIPHDEVMAEVRAIIDKHKRRHAESPTRE